MENYRLDPFSDEFGPLKRKVKDGDPVLKIIYSKAEEEVKGLAQKISAGIATEEEIERYNLLLDQWIGPDEGKINGN